MITRTHITLEETVGEFVISLHVPVGLSFATAIATVDSMKSALESFAARAAEQAQSVQNEQPNQPDIPQQDQVDAVTQA